MEDLYENLLEEEEESSKIGRYEISSYTIDKPIETLIKWKKNGKLIVPDFQRDFVWKFNIACRLIDSVLLNLPIPGIFVCRRIINGEEKYYLIDGLQRITTLEQFKDLRFVSKELGIDKEFKIGLKNSDWYLKTFDKLSQTDQENFLDYSISLTVFEISEKNESKNLNSMFEIFERINTGSEKLTSQEIRNAVYPGECLERLKELSKYESYKNLIIKDEKGIKRKKEQEIFLRFATYYTVFNRYSSDKQDLFDGGPTISSSKIESLNNYLYYSNMKKIDYEYCFDLLCKAFDVISKFDDTAFYTIKRDFSDIGNSIHETFAEALVIAVIKNNFIIRISKDSFKKWKLDSWNQEIFKPFVESTLNKNSIIQRVNILESLINGQLYY